MEIREVPRRNWKRRAAVLALAALVIDIAIAAWLLVVPTMRFTCLRIPRSSVT